MKKKVYFESFMVIILKVKVDKQQRNLAWEFPLAQMEWFERV